MQLLEAWLAASLFLIGLAARRFLAHPVARRRLPLCTRRAANVTGHTAHRRF